MSNQDHATIAPTMRFDMHDLAEGIRAMELARDVVEAWAVEFWPRAKASSPWELSVKPFSQACFSIYLGGEGQSFTALCLETIREIRNGGPTDEEALGWE